jgi:hypothetical protein
VGREAPAGSPVERLLSRVSNDFLEEARHLLLVTRGQGLAAAATGAAFAGMGHPTRYFTLQSLSEELATAADRGLLAALRELDAITLIVVDQADPRDLDPPSLERVARFLAHRLDRASVVLAGADAATWIATRPGDAALGSFFAACEVIDLSAMAHDAFVADS